MSGTIRLWLPSRAVCFIPGRSRTQEGKELHLIVEELEERIAPSIPPGLEGYEGQPGNQGGHGGDGTPEGLQGYEGQPGNQGG